MRLASGRLPGRANSNRGFTLIEIMIVVVILGILLGVALPGYQNSMQKGRRADAKAALLDVANRQEQFMLDQGTYTVDMTALGLAANPYISEEEHYSVTAAACAGGTIDRCYVLTAVPRASSPQADDSRCTQFQLSSNGAKQAAGSDIENCW